MRGGFVAMRPDPSNLGFEQCDALAKLVLRIRRKIFGCEKARCIAPWARPIVVVHV